MHKLLSSSYQFTVIGILISVAIGIVLWLVGHDTVGSITLSLLVTLSGLVLDVISRLHDLDDKLATLIGLDRQLQSDEWLGKMIRELVDSYYKSKNWKNEVLDSRAQSSIKHCVDDVHQISTGSFDARMEEELPINTDVLLSVKKSFKATSFVSIADWWQTEQAKKYLYLHKRLIDDGGQVERVFIVTSFQELIESRSLICFQIEMGITCWVTWSKTLHPSMLEDFIIADDKIMSISRLARDGRPMNIGVSIDPWIVSSYSEKFKSLVLASKDAKFINWDTINDLRENGQWWSLIDVHAK